MGTTDEWYTPEKYVEAARRVLGEIDLDPASCDVANKTVKAKKYYTREDDGLLKIWAGRVYLNPPFESRYGHSGQDLWINSHEMQYLYGKVDAGISIVNNATDARWFQNLWKYHICFTNHRVRFISPNGVKKSPISGNAIVYFGDKPEMFVKEFREFGHVVRP